MNSHELAALLLSAPDLPVAVQVHGHTYQSDVHGAHGTIQVAVMRRLFSRGECIVLGNDLEDIGGPLMGSASPTRFIKR